MPDFLDIKYKHWHALIIQIVLFFVMIGIYFSLKNDPKIIAVPGSISICLLGSYIALNAGANFGHDLFHGHSKKV